MGDPCHKMKDKPESRDELILACKEGSLERVQSLIAEKLDVNKIEQHPAGCYASPLLQACRYNHPHLLELLLKNGAKSDLEIPTTDDQHIQPTDTSPLAICIEKFICTEESCPKLEACKLLHRFGAVLNKIYDSVGSLMHVVAKSGCHHVAEWLIEQGCNINIIHRNISALQIAVSSKNNKVAKCLIQANASPDDQLKVLGLAIIRDNKDIVNMLVEAGVFHKIHTESPHIQILFSTNWLIIGNDYMKTLFEKTKSKVPELQHICRQATRQCIGICSQSRVDSLPIPTLHKDYIRLNELDDNT